MRIKDIDFTDIQNILKDAIKQADLIRENLKIKNLSLKDRDFFANIKYILTKLNYKVVFTDKLKDVKGYGHLPSMIIYNDQNKKESGGTIYIYDKYSDNKKRELLLHEFVHIHDFYIPVWSTDNNDLRNGYMLSETVKNAIELRTELISLELMMPINEFQKNLFHHSHDIDIIITLYKGIETSTIIKWIILHDYFNAHYAIIYFVKIHEKTGDNIEEKEIEKIIKIDEYCRDNNAFDILNILSNEKSYAYKTRKDMESKSGVSKIDNKSYKCFCYYEKNVRQPLPLNVSPLEIILPCDKMVIIGWSIEIYNTIRKLELKQKK